VSRPPNSAPESVGILADFVRTAQKNSVILRDFNLPGIDWQDWSSASGRGRQFLHACEEAELEQFVNFPTQVRRNTLDLILSNAPDRFFEVKDVRRLGKSDHVIIQASLDICALETKTMENIPHWARADWAGIWAGIREGMRERLEQNLT
jgi:hypothetical protein